MRLSTYLTAQIVVLFGACAGESGEGGEGLSLARFIAEAAEQGCANIVRCGSDNPDLAPFIAATRERPDLCASMFGDLSPRHQYSAHVADGTTVYDPEAAELCLAALAKACNETFHEVVECDAVFVGTVPLGGACKSTIVCAGDAFCDNFDSACGEGTCVQRAPFGESCNARECTHSNGPSSCGSFGCLPLVETTVGEGEQCGDLDSPERVTHARCDQGLFCSDHSTSDVTRRCLRRVARGAPCDASRDLCVDSGDVCVPDTNGAERCLPVTLRSEVNTSCGPNPNLDGACNLLEALVCDNGICVEWDRTSEWA